MATTEQGKIAMLLSCGAYTDKLTDQELLVLSNETSTGGQYLEELPFYDKVKGLFPHGIHSETAEAIQTLAKERFQS